MAAVAGNGISSDDQFIHHHSSQNAAIANSISSSDSASDAKAEFQRDVQELVDLLSKLNPSAKEFFPSYYSPDRQSLPSHYSGTYNDLNGDGSPKDLTKRNNYYQGRRRLNGRALRAQREDSIRRTVYVCDIDQHVTEEQLAALFVNCGQVVDCRICGDPHSALRFAFIEFADEQGAKEALNLAGIMVGGYNPVKVLPSKTAILPVNPTFLPRSEDEREMCARTVYCTNIDNEVTQNDVKIFFESICGEVSRLRLLGDHVNSTRIAFVEFVMADSAIFALSCSGFILGNLPIRISPSKTPVRSRRAIMN